jgi:hypothetical protein
VSVSSDGVSKIKEAVSVTVNSVRNKLKPVSVPVN